MTRILGVIACLAMTSAISVSTNSQMIDKYNKTSENYDNTFYAEDCASQQSVEHDKNLISFRDGFLTVDNGIAMYYSAQDTTGVIETELPFAPVKAFDCDGEAVILGEDAQLAIYENRQWVIGQKPDIDDIEGFTKFEDSYIVVSQNYVAISSDLSTWEFISTGFDSPAVGIASTDSYIVAVSENGVMLRSEDCIEWTPFYHNAYYDVNFTFYDIISVESTFYALAIDDDQMPILTSARSGLVWNQRTAEIYNDDGNGVPDVRQYNINDAVWDGSQFMLVGDDGIVIALPSCSKCNALSVIGTENWVKGLCEGGIMALLADDGTVEIISTDAVRQTAISVEETKTQMEQGTPLIDVRTIEEYAEGHIQGSINIPLADLETELQTLYSDKNQTIIFYCGTGMRSQKAVDAAQEIGYEDVYNMGAMDNWYD